MHIALQGVSLDMCAHHNHSPTCHCLNSVSSKPLTPKPLNTTLLSSSSGTLSNKACNGIHWSPNGHNIVLSGLKALNGQLEFFNVDEFEVLAAAEHFMATGGHWVHCTAEPGWKLD